MGTITQRLLGRSIWRLILAVVLAPIPPALAWAASVDWSRDATVYIGSLFACLLYSYTFTVVIGLPLHVALRRLGKQSYLAYGICGAVTALIMYDVSWFLMYFFINHMSFWLSIICALDWISPHPIIPDAPLAVVCGLIAGVLFRAVLFGAKSRIEWETAVHS